jgi:DNA-binding XRE family transcriptional regulator
MVKPREKTGSRKRTDARAKGGEESLKSWIDHQIESDVAFKAKVEERLSQLRQELVKIRVEKGLTQAEVSRRARLSQPYIAKLESGEASNPELRTLARLATALGAKLSFENS